MTPAIDSQPPPLYRRNSRALVVKLGARPRGTVEVYETSHSADEAAAPSVGFANHPSADLHHRQNPLRDDESRAVIQRSRGRTLLEKAWLPGILVLATALGGLGMYEAHESSAPGPGLSVSPPQAPEEFTPKRLTYELFGDLGGGGMLSYIDLAGYPHVVQLSALPWSHVETTNLSVVSGSISAQVHGKRVGCRMLVDDVVRDEQSADRQDADVTCRVKSA